uniref:UDP-N-acetylglucosamine--dolichyl-phosphate N-acetylglucosaminephosphotransferase n=1 Tax=Noctiluca scintillans TaxID=2966 RepID=A0A7S1AY46_NOCSC|mmetsp:Transcript_6508/g.18243  ORF Transcript_6508/g.18243 Transcript_6508/m.18243 type:complete len:457 (+) Transcript_6508:104-1474(+)
MKSTEDCGSRAVLDGLLLAAGVAVLAGMFSVAQPLPHHLQISLAVCGLLSVVAFVATSHIIQGMGETFIKAGLRGIDLNKKTTKREDGVLVRPIEGIPIPESQGTVCAVVYILVMSVFIPFAFAYDPDAFPHAKLAEFLAALLTIALASFMGFADDVLDLKWRHKIPIPFLCTLPLLLVYRVNGGLTGIMVPHPFRELFGEYLDLGLFFYLAILIQVVFSTHAINIYAGVNGLEAGQSVIMGIAVLIINITQLHRIPDGHEAYRERQVQSMFLLAPFLCASVALFRLNWFPAKVFVGDTYCYFGGMTLAVVCVVGHANKTLWLLQFPQLLNFVYSLPQLFRFIGIPQPRHRMPWYDTKTGYVINSYTDPFRREELPGLGRVVFWILRNFRLAHVVPHADGTFRVSNLTLINFVMYVCGPSREDVLCCRLLLLQVLSVALCFIVRFGVAGYLFEEVL